MSALNPIRNYLLLFLVTLLPLAGTSQSFPLSEESKVSILTCGLGNEMYSLFGHTAIRITDPARNFDVVYNYGAFDFNTPNFVARFSKGDLQYFVTSDRFEDFLYAYNYDKRSVWEQQLAMSITEKQLLFDELNATLNSDKKFYTYKFIDRNCTTMVVDILNRAYGKNVIQKKPTDETFREVLYPYFDNHFYEQLGTSIIFGAKVDDNAAHIFLPIELLDNIKIAQNKGRPILMNAKTWLEFEVPNTGSWWNNWFTYVLLLALIVIANIRIVTMIYLLIAGAIGLFFSLGGLYSDHGELAWNYNALLFNPAFLVLAFFLLRKNMRMFRYTALFCIAGIAIYLALLLNKIHLLIVLPLVVAHLVLLGRFAFPKLSFRRRRNLMMEAANTDQRTYKTS